MEAIYAGTQFRSRLEARWAAFFDVIRWHWTYEPFEGSGYIPDFLIHGGRELLVEVRPVSREDQYEAQVETIKVPDWYGDIVVVGIDPICLWPESNYDSEAFPVAGLMGEAYDDWDEEHPFDRNWEAAQWNTCGKCGVLAVHHSEMSYASRPCGHYDGDRYLGFVSLSDLHEAWAKACNMTRWLPK